MGSAADLVVVVGGDGSLLGFGREMAARASPWWASIAADWAFWQRSRRNKSTQSFKKYSTDKFTTEEHFLLQASIMRDGEVIAQQSALNDVVVSPGGVMGMMEFSLWLNDEFVYDQRSDGLIVASPTGSTAYALSAGGPIMHPGLDAIVVVPMFPHTLTSRPLVVPGDNVLRLRLQNSSSASPQISCDSQVQIKFQAEDEITFANTRMR